MRLLFIALAVASCSLKKPVSTEVVTAIVHGKSFGHCVGYCMWEQVYTSDEMTTMKSSRQETQYPAVKITDNFSQDQMDRLLADFDLERFRELPETLGCPDCADGGAEYIEIRTATSVKRVTFENGKAPYGFENFTLALTQEYEKHKSRLEE